METQYQKYMKLPIEKQVDKYGFNTGAELGGGSYSTVYLGRDMGTGEPVAIKMVSKSIIQDEYLKNCLIGEINLMKGLDHPNLVKFYNCFETEKNIYIIIEYCNGKSLRDYLKRKVQLGEAECVRIIRQVINGYEELLRHGILHRDIKPENVVIHDGVYKICDFGFAKKVADSKALNISILGSPLYMAPQVMEGIYYT